MTRKPTRQDVLIAVAALIALLPLTAVIALSSIPAPAAWIVLVLAVVAHAALVWRRAHPLGALLVISAALGGEVVVTGLFFLLPSSLVFVIALYAATAYGTRWPPLSIGLAGSAAAAARYAADPSIVDSGFGPAPWLLFLLFAAVVLCAWTMGLLRRAQLLTTRVAEERAAAERRDHAQRAALAAYEQRARISRDMHDVLAHSLSVIIGQARVARFDAARAGAALGVIEDTARDSLHEIRGLLRDIRDDGPGARPRPQPTLAELPELIEQARALGSDVTQSTQGTPVPIGSAAQLAIYRFVQESLTNVAKHAHAGAAVAVTMRWERGQLTVNIANDRVRARPRPDTVEPGMGLQGMGERLRPIGGTVIIDDANEGEYSVTAIVPSTVATQQEFTE
ncbi:sensor histidine kinase [Agromyces laixinhei]|uniref:sensor histidine kinase n=1 Tax=Agromyces laixinhei TaxID=2585717 RepID=UPI0012ECC7C3|nr:histidine kinase [Agromyces laixinhei]